MLISLQTPARRSSVPAELCTPTPHTNTHTYLRADTADKVTVIQRQSLLALSVWGTEMLMMHVTGDRGKRKHLLSSPVKLGGNDQTRSPAGQTQTHR